MNASIDAINRRTMRQSARLYAGFSEIGPGERHAFAGVADEFAGGRILDVGVGGGRTVEALLRISSDYLGVDYVPEMVERCRARFPGVRFEHADARAMPQFADASFDVIVFAWSGICMVNHAGRLAILGEVRRLLRPGGVFIFSTCNSPEHRRWLNCRPSPDRTVLLPSPKSRPASWRTRRCASSIACAICGIRWTRPNTPS